MSPVEEWQQVCRLAELEVERGATALVHGQALAIFRTHGDEVYALGNYDPFAKASVLARGIVGSRGDIPFVASPMHKHGFDLRTGQCLDDPGVHVPVYAVKIVDGCRARGSSQGRHGGRMTAPEEPLAGYRVGVTAARKADEQTTLLKRRGALVEWAPALSVEPNQINEVALHAATVAVLAEPVDIFIATTGIGMKSWFAAAESWGLFENLQAHLGSAEILARGPKSVGALRRRGLRELWSPESECFEDVLAHLRGRDLTDRRIVVQEHGQSLSVVAHALRRQGRKGPGGHGLPRRGRTGSGAAVSDDRPDR